ncbi:MULTISPECIES: hypothetical protein [Bacteria]|uniref:hypothetical protein n=1 Tax=Bacteria TaxID=2 RepID=UPI002598A797|nr:MULTISPECIES: hypothetical protein [Bacteria]MDM3980660.1 hypothetical protein [Staphylococcus haemolyticus]MEA3652094.1 hypothetical protein [Acinetobacter baumannii]
MTVTLSQKSYDALLDDLEKLRERNAELERKLDKEVKRKVEAFDEILNVDYIVAPDDYAHEITKIVDKYREEQ